MNQLPDRFDFAATEPEIYKAWMDAGAFRVEAKHSARVGGEREPYTIMIPLPNVTAILHVGHGLNDTVQDVIIRWARMKGTEALWMPGTDHAGIATQAVVERRMLEEEGLTRHDIGREALVNRIWLWKDAYEKRIIGQLKMLGASCDWRRRRFTLDEVCSKAVRRTFFKLFQDGLIYRGKRLVNWDTYLQTAVADDEVTPEEVDTKPQRKVAVSPQAPAPEAQPAALSLMEASRRMAAAGSVEEVVSTVLSYTSTRLARSICRDHLVCFGSMLAFLVLWVADTTAL